MAYNKYNNKRKKTEQTDQPRKRKLFKAVDVWRSQFGPVSERAIRDVYAQRFNVKINNVKDYSLSHCINALRKLEDPEYEKPTDQSS